MNLDPNTDYLVVFPDEPVEKKVHYGGGRNIVIFGGHIQVLGVEDDLDNENHGLQLIGPRGIVHIEGYVSTGLASPRGSRSHLMTRPVPRGLLRCRSRRLTSATFAGPSN